MSNRFDRSRLDPLKVGINGWYRHDKTGNLYRILSISDKVKLFGFWIPVQLVHYTSSDPLDLRVYCRPLGQFCRRFSYWKCLTNP